MLDDHQTLGKYALLLMCSTLACKSGSPKAKHEAGNQRADEPPVAAEPEPGAAAPNDAALEHARTMTKTFAKQLQTTLLAAIEEGGPAHAISVCKDDAPRITAEQAKDGWSLSRTALRVRNPKNAPTAWQREVLEGWQAKIEAGEVADPATLEWSQVIETDGATQLRYMRAIPLGGVCLACHGPAETITPEVEAKLAELYPDDQATGFTVGQLRGAFVVTGPI